MTGGVEGVRTELLFLLCVSVLPCEALQLSAHALMSFESTLTGILMVKDPGCLYQRKHMRHDERFKNTSNVSMEQISPKELEHLA